MLITLSVQLDQYFLQEKTSILKTHKTKRKEFIYMNLRKETVPILESRNRLEHTFEIAIYAVVINF